MSNEQSAEWRAGYEEGVRSALKRSCTTRGLTAPGDTGVNISSVKLMRFALSDLPQTVEILDGFGLPLRGEVADNYSYGKALFVYGRRFRPITLGEPF